MKPRLSVGEQARLEYWGASGVQPAQREYVGYTKAPSGKHYLIGVGPLDWLKARMHNIEGGVFVFRDVTPDDMEADYYHERDLSGAEARGDK